MFYVELLTICFTVGWFTLLKTVCGYLDILLLRLLMMMMMMQAVVDWCW